MKESGELAAHLARTSFCTTPSFDARSRYSGGFFGSGDQAAGVASCARSKNPSLAESSAVFTAASFFSSSKLGGPAGRAERQHGLIMYTLPKTSECFMPMRVAP